MTQDIRFKLALDGASQVQAGLAGVGQAFAVSATDAQKMEAATAAAALAQAKLDAAVARSIAAQRAYADASKDTATSQATLTKLAIEQAQAQVNQVAAASKLREQSAAVKALETAHLGLATQTKLTTYQTAQMSAQLQDLFVQIQAGGNPMTALIQQGSQLSAVFGGVGPALRAVAGLITPVVAGVVALTAVIGGLGLAWAAGRRESSAFRADLALTNNAAGVTADGVRAMADRIAKDTKAGIGTAREALQVLVASGRVSGDALQATAAAAAALSRATGESAEDIAKRFAGMADNVADSARKLNEQYHFLTVAQYQQIKALEDHGRAQEALAVLMQALGANVNKTVDQLGALEKAWLEVTTAMGRFKDAWLDIGRDQSPQQKIEIVKAQLAELAKAGQKGYVFGPSADDLRKQAELLQVQIDLQAKLAKGDAEKAAREAAALRFEDKIVAAMSEQEKLQKRINDLAGQAKAAGKGLTDKDVTAVLNDATVKSPAFAQALAEAQARVDSAAGTAAAKIRAQIQSLQSLFDLGLLRQTDYINRVTDLEIKALEADKARLVQQRAAAASRAALGDESSRASVTSLTGQITEKDIEINARMTKGVNDLTLAIQKQAFATRDAMLALRDEGQAQIDQQLEQQTQQRNAITRSIEEYKTSVAESAESIALETSVIYQSDRARRTAVEQFKIELDLRKRIREIQATPYDSQADRQAAIDAATAVANAAKANAAKIVDNDELDKARKEQLSAWKQINDQIGQSLSDALMQGGRSAREYIKGIFRSMVLRPIIQAVISPVTGSIATVLSGTASAANGYQASAGLFNTGTAAVNAYSSAAGFVGLFSSNAAYGAAAGAADLIAAFGPYALIALAIFAALGDHSKWSMGSVSETLFGSDGKFSSTQFALPYQFGYNTEHQRDDKATKAVTDSISTSLAAAFKQFGASSAGLGVSVTTDADREGQVAAIVSLLRDGRVLGGTQTGSGSFGSALPTVAAEKIDSAQLDAWFKTALPQVIIAALQQSDLTGRFKDYFNSVTAGADLTAEKAAELLQTAGAVKTLSEAFVPLGGVFEQLGTLAVQTVADFAKVAGGFDSLSAATQTYYQAFYTEAERAKITTASLSKSLASVGLVLPDVSAGAEKARIAYRALVDSQDLSTEAGQKAVTVLLQSAGAFGTLIEAATQAEQAAKEKAAAIAEKQSSLEVQLLRTQGNELAAVAKERELELAALRELDPALASLQQQIYDTADAAAKANLMSSAPSSKITSLNMLESGAQAILGWLDLTAYKRQIDIYQPGALGSGVSVPQNWLDHLANNDPGWNREFVDQSAAYWKRALEMASDRSNKAVSEDYQALIARWNSSGAEDPKAKLAQDQLSATQSLISTLDSLEASLEDYTKSLLLGDLSTLSPEQQYAQARAAVDTALAQSRVGDLAAMQSAQAAIDAFLRTSKSFNASGGQYAADFEAMVAALEELKALQKQMLSVTAAAGAGTESAVRDGNAITQQSLAYQLIDRSRNVE